MSLLSIIEPMKSVVLLLLCALSQGEWPISIISDFEGIQFSDTQSQIVLTNNAVGYNLTYSIAGTYTDEDGDAIDAPQPFINQRLFYLGQISKATQYTPSPAIGMVSLPRTSARFSVSGNTIYVWDFATFRVNTTAQSSANYTFPQDIENVFLLTDLFSDTEATIIGVLTLNCSTPHLEVLTYFNNSLLSLEWATFESQWEAIATGSCYQPHIKVLYCTFAGLSTEGQSVILSQSVNFNTGKLSVIYNNTFGTTEPPLAVIIDEDWSAVCFRNWGVFIVKTSDLFIDDTIEVLGRIYNSTETYLACARDPYFLFVSTSSGTFIYEYYNNVLFPIYGYPAYPDPSVTISVASDFTTAGTLIAFAIQAEGRSPSFRTIRNSYVPNLIDQNLCSLVSTCDLGSAVFSIAMVNYTIRAIFETSEGFSIYEIFDDPVINFPSSFTYNFTGTLTISNEVSSVQSAKIQVQSLDPQMPEIYTTRNTLPGDGYLTPGRVERALNYKDTFAARMYIPLTNYFSGQDLKYSVSLLSSDSEALLDIPPMVSFRASYVFNASSPNPILTYIECDQVNLTAAENHNTIYFFSAVRETDEWKPLFHVQLEDDGYDVTEMVSVNAKVEKEHRCLLVVQKSQPLGPDEFNYHWSLFELTASEAKLQTSNQTFLHSQHRTALQAMRGLLASYLPDSLEIYSFAHAANNSVAFASPCAVSGKYYPAKFADNHHFNFSFIWAVDDSCTLFEVNYDQLIGCTSFPQAKLNCSSPENYEMLFLIIDSYFSYVLLDQTLPDYLSVFKLYSNAQINSFPLIIPGWNATIKHSGGYLVIYEETPTSNILLFIDIFADSIRSLVTSVDIGAATTFTLVPVNEQFRQYIAVAYDGQSLTRVLVGQRAEFWSPQSDLVPSNSKENTIWARLTFPFKGLENTLSHTAQIRITADNRFSGLSAACEVNASLLNTGSFLMGNLNQSSPLLSNETVNIDQQGLKLRVPSESFIGTDIAYGLVVNGNLGTPLLPSPDCGNKSFFACVSSKYIIDQTYNSTVLDEGAVVVSAIFQDNTTYYLSSSSLAVEVAHTITNVIDFHSGDNLNCQEMFRVKRAADLLVIFCFSNSFGSAYLLHLNVTSGAQLYCEIQAFYTAIVADYDDVAATTRVLVLTEVVNVYTVTAEGFQLADSISAYSLELPIFMPLSAAFYETNYMLLLEEKSNTVVMLQLVGSFRVVATLRPDSPKLREIALLPDFSLLAITQNTTVLRYSITPLDDTFQFSLQQVISPVDIVLDEYRPSWALPMPNSALAQNANGTMIAFAFFEQGKARIRVVDLTEADSSAIVATSPPLAGSGDQSVCYDAIISFMDLGDDLCHLLVLRSYYYLIATEIDIVSISHEVTVTFYPYNPESPTKPIIQLQLLAFNTVSRVIGPSFLINYTACRLHRAWNTEEVIVIDEKKYYTGIFRQWWVWVLLGFAAVVLGTVLMMLILRRVWGKKKAQPRLMEEIELNTDA